MKNFKYKGVEYKLKESWDEVSLNDYNSLKKDGSLKNQLSVLTGLPVPEIKDMPASIVEAIVKELNYFWNEEIKGTDEIYITLDGEKLFVDFSDLSLGQWVDAEELIKRGVEENLHTIIAILTKPITLKYSEYNWEAVSKKILNCSIREVMNIINFFLSIQKILEDSTQASIRLQKNQI